MPERARGNLPARRFQCVLCGRTDYFDGGPDEGADTARSIGWRHTRNATAIEGRDWICPIHSEPGSYKVFWDVDQNRTVVDPNKGGPPVER